MSLTSTKSLICTAKRQFTIHEVHCHLGNPGCVGISDTIYGPYHLRHEGVPCGGGTGFFQDKDKNWWQAYFGEIAAFIGVGSPEIIFSIDLANIGSCGSDKENTRGGW